MVGEFQQGSHRLNTNQIKKYFPHSFYCGDHARGWCHSTKTNAYKDLFTVKSQFDSESGH